MLDLLRNVETKGFAGAPRALGVDDQGREVLTYVEGEVGTQHRPGQTGGGDLPAYVWRDEVLVHLGALIREYHDAAATFPWAGRQWCFGARQPVETVCHNEVFPWNTVFREGLPVAFIDWDTAAPGPRAWDLGLIASVWIPLWADDKCRVAGLPAGITEKARRLRLLLDTYGSDFGGPVVRAGIDRMQNFLEHLRELAEAGSAWEVEMTRNGVLDELVSDIEWMEENADALVK